jgi:hypothetical protein
VVRGCDCGRGGGLRDVRKQNGGDGGGVDRLAAVENGLMVFCPSLKLFPLFRDRGTMDVLDESGYSPASPFARQLVEKLIGLMGLLGKHAPLDRFGLLFNVSLLVLPDRRSDLVVELPVLLLAPGVVGVLEP